MLPSRARRLMLPALAAAALLAACGSGDDTAQSTTVPSPAAAATSAATAPAAAASPAATPAQSASRQFTDDNGKVMTIAQPPKKVVALSPSVVEMLYTVGAPPAARVSSASYPEAARALPAVGTSYQPSIEQIAALAPDLILADQQLQRGDLLKELEKVAPVYAMRLLTVDDVTEGLRTTGQITGRPEQGEKAAKEIEDKLKNVQAKLPAQRPGTFIMIGVPDAFFAAKPSSFVGDVVAKLGAKNLVTEGADGAGFPGFTAYSMEKLVALDPDVILVATAAAPNAPKTSQALASNPAWAGLKAVKAGRVYEINPVTLVQAAGPRVSQEIDELAAYLYPDLFPKKP